jgi:hypothetical protein
MKTKIQTEFKFIVTVKNGLGVQFVDPDRWGLCHQDEADMFDDPISANEAIERTSNLKQYGPAIVKVEMEVA